MSAIRDESGKFIKGVSGNPTGRPKTPEEIKMALKEIIPEAVEKLKNLIRHTEDERLLLEAIKVALDRVYGKPTQALDIESVSKSDNTVTIRLEGDLQKWSR